MNFMQQIIAWWIFGVRGWKVEGTFPFELKKSILVVAPHTHYLDFFLGLAIRKRYISNLCTFWAKKSFFGGFLG